MMRNKLEIFFSYKKTIFLLFFLITLFFAANIKNINLDFDFDPKISAPSSSPFESYFLEKNKESASQEIQNITNKPKPGKKRVIAVVVYSRDLFSIAKLSSLNHLKNQLAENPHVASIDSLYNVQDVQYFFRNNEIRPVIQGSEKSLDQIKQLKSKVIKNKLLHAKYINPQGTAFAFYLTIEPETSQQLYQTRESIEAILTGFSNQFEAVYQVGSVEVEDYLFKATSHDSASLGILGLVLLVLIYGLFFKKILLGILPFMTSIVALIWTGGLLALTSVPINALCSIVLMLVFSIGAMECAHFINVYQRMRREMPDARASFCAAQTLRHIFWPIFFASITTIIGLFCNIFTSIKFLQDFAITISIALSFNLIIICIVLPLLLELVISNKEEKTEGASFYSITDIIFRLVGLLKKHYILMGVFLVAFIISGALLLPKVPFETIPYINFYKNSTVIQKMEETNKYLTGMRSFPVYIGLKQKQGFREKENLDKLLKLQHDINQLPETSNTLSIASITAALFQLYMDDGDAKLPAYRVPNSSAFIKTVFDSLTSLPQIGRLVANNDRIAKIYITYQVYTTLAFENYLANITNILQTDLAGTSLSFEVPNTVLGMLGDLKHVISVQLMSIVIIYLSLFVIMWWSFKSFTAGIVAIIPNLFPFLGIVSIMYFLNIPFFAMSIIVLAVIVGLAVDDTIHILFSFKKHYLETLDVDKAAYEALKSQMRPVTITSVSLILAFSVLMFSTLKSIMIFSGLLCFGVFMAWLSDMIVTPFLLRKINIVKYLR